LEKKVTNIVLESVNKHEVSLWLPNTSAKCEATTAFQLQQKSQQKYLLTSERAPHDAHVLPSPARQFAPYLPGTSRNFGGLNNSLPLNFNTFSVPYTLQKLTCAVHVVAQNHKWGYLALASNLNFRKMCHLELLPVIAPQLLYICGEWGSLGDIRRRKGRVMPQGISHLFLLSP